MDKTIIQYAQAVHRSIHGAPLPTFKGLFNPFEDINPNTLKELVDNAPLEAIEAEFEAKLNEDWDLKLKNKLPLSNMPVRVTKGNKDMRGIDGWVVHDQQRADDPDRKAMFVYDFKNSKGGWVADHAVKIRTPKWNEWETEVQTYITQCESISHLFTRGKRVRHKTTGEIGLVLFDCSLNPNWNGNGFHQCKVEWQQTNTKDYISPLLLDII